MKAARLTSTFLLGFAICLTWGLASVLADPPDACTNGVPDVGYGDGSDGDLDVYPGPAHELEPDKNYRNVTIYAGATLDTRGNVLRVCSVLTNYGTITDTFSGGDGGDEGDGGDGGYGYLPQHPPTNGQCGEPGEPGEPYDPNHPDKPLRPCAGEGGNGGGGGGGGGGAWNIACINRHTAGGDGGDGGKGGQGGGCVIIYAYRLDNQNEIQVDGLPGDDGDDGDNARYDDYYCPPLPEWEIFHRDQSSGEGGGGAGGDGGDAGTVEIHYAHLDSLGDVHAFGGAGGQGGDPGDIRCDDLDYDSGSAQRYQLGASGACGGAAGGESDVGTQCGPNRAQSGDNGDPGANGRLILIPGNTDVLRYYLHLQIDPYQDPGWIGGYNVMRVQSLVDGLTSFSFRLDGDNLDISMVRISGGDENGPWEMPPLDWQWLSDNITVLVELGDTYNQDDILYLRVDYEGHPQPADGDGMFFEEHGILPANKAPIVVSTVEPWFAYSWWPVKDDGDNWNCDKATAELTFTVPTDQHDLVVVSNGVLDGVDDLGGQKRYRWRTEHETAAYLFCVAVTNYDLVQPPSEITDVQLYFWPELPHSLPGNRAKWERVTEMLELYADPDHFGPYPFADEKYAIYQWGGITGSKHGGMEHQTAAGQDGYWYAGREGSRLFSRVEWNTCHEFAHMWWGDLITCADWHNIWLNEGFACWTETFWFENQWNEDRRPFRCFDSPLEVLRFYVRTAHRPGQQTLSRSVYVHDISDPSFNSGGVLDYKLQYKKAPWVLHMLRHLVDPQYDGGDTPRFFQLLRDYRAEQEPCGCATTADFQAVAEAFCDDPINPPAPGDDLYDLWESYPGHPGGGAYRDLDWYFGQWVYHGGAPAYRYKRLPAAAGHVRFCIKQPQPALFNDPLFTMPIDIDIHRVGVTEPTRHIVWNNAVGQQEYDIEVGPGIHWLSFDPDRWVLKRWAIPEVPGLLTDLGTGVDTAEERAVRVNGLAQAVCSARVTGGNERASFWLAERYYDLEAGLNGLGTLGGTWSAAYDINDEGQIVGDAADSNGLGHAFLWLPEPAYGLDAGMHSLGAGAHARGINDLGQVVGFTGTSSDGEAVLWEYNSTIPAWTVIQLNSLGGAENQAWAINNGAQVAGWSENESEELHAVTWEYDWETEEWVITDLGPGKAYCINDVGQVGGHDHSQATLWAFQQEGGQWTPTPLPTGRPPVPPESLVYGINNVGQAVGVSGDRAVLWQPGQNGPNRDWQEIDVTEEYLSSVTSCWVLTAAWDIDEAGQVVGYGTVNGESSAHVFLLNPGGTGDCNSNGLLDACDLFGDDDGDGAVDLTDYVVFAGCMTGPAVMADDACLCMLDADDDHDVDLADFAAFQRTFTGP